MTTGELQRLIDNDGLKGLTSNPTIFQKAVEGSEDYDDLFREWAPRGASAGDVFEALAIRDIGDAARIFRPVWEKTRHRDGYCSIEVTPTLAHDTQGDRGRGAPALEEARRPQRDGQDPRDGRGRSGHRAVRLRGSQHQRDPALQPGRVRRRRRGLHPGAGEASRPRRGRLARAPRWRASSSAGSTPWWRRPSPSREKAGATPQQKALFDEIAGKVAIANAKQAYQKYKKLFSGPRWQALADKGAKTQRVLWASTGTKNPKYSRRPLRRGADRAGHGEHHPAGDARRLPRPRQGAADPGRGARARPMR